jgi:hypothetical protein
VGRTPNFSCDDDSLDLRAALEASFAHDQDGGEPPPRTSPVYTKSKLWHQLEHEVTAEQRSVTATAVREKERGALLRARSSSKAKPIVKSRARLRMQTQSGNRAKRTTPSLRFKHRSFTAPSRETGTQNNASSARLRRYLVGEMTKSPRFRPKPQKQIYQSARQEIGPHSFRNFRHEWVEAIKLVPGCTWSSPGAPRGKRKSITEDQNKRRR